MDFGYLVTSPPPGPRHGVADQLAHHRPAWALLTRHVQFTDDEIHAFDGYEKVAQGESADGEIKVTIVKRRSSR